MEEGTSITSTQRHAHVQLDSSDATLKSSHHAIAFVAFRLREMHTGNPLRSPMKPLMRNIAKSPAANVFNPYVVHSNDESGIGSAGGKGPAPCPNFLVLPDVFCQAAPSHLASCSCSLRTVGGHLAPDGGENGGMAGEGASAGMCSSRKQLVILNIINQIFEYAMKLSIHILNGSNAAKSKKEIAFRQATGDGDMIANIPRQLQKHEEKRRKASWRMKTRKARRGIKSWAE